MRYLILLCLSLAAAHCAYKPEDAGLCKLNCSSAIIGGNDSPMAIELKTGVSDLSCSLAAGARGEVYPDPLLAQFNAVEKFDDGTDGGGKRPVPFLSFEPIVNGSRSELPVHNPNVTITDNVFTPARYKGIATLKSNWCTDTCGVGTLEVFAVCPPPGKSSQIGMQIHSGALYSEIAVFNISTPDN